MFRFSIRDVLWLTVVVAMGLAWWAAERLRGRENALLREEVAILLERYPPSEAEAKEAHVIQLTRLRAVENALRLARNNEELEKAIRTTEATIKSVRAHMSQTP